MCEAGPRAARWFFSGMLDGNVLSMCPSRSVLHEYVVRSLDSSLLASTKQSR